VPKAKTADEWRELVNDVLSRNVSFVNDRRVQSIKKTHSESDLKDMTIEEVRSLIKKAPERKRKDDAIEIIIKELGDGQMVAENQLRKIRQRLINNSELTELLK
jgi:hypothetical protein